MSHLDSLHSFVLQASSSSPNLFPISGLARLGVKPRLYRSSWRAFASTHSLMLPFTSPREALLACLPVLFGTCLPSLWSPPFPLHTLALILLSLVKVRLSPTLTIWYLGQTALFLFFLAKATLAYLPTALSVALRPLYLILQAQYVLVFPLKPAPFCTLFAGLGSTNKSAISLLFSFYLDLAVFSPSFLLLHLSSYHKLCGRSATNCFFSPLVC